MAWTTPPTFVSGNTLTAAQLNILGDDLLETAPGKATNAGWHFVATGTNGIAQREITRNTVTFSNGVSSGGYAGFSNPGPVVSVSTGPASIAGWGGYFDSTTASGIVVSLSVAISSATTVAASDTWALRVKHFDSGVAGRHSGSHLFTGLSTGTNIHTCQAKTNTGGATISDREMWVVAL